jgi:hypothetical protein
MAAITWRSLNAAVPDVGRNLAYAQEGFNAGFDRLDKLLADRQAVNQGVIDREDEALFQSSMNRVADIRDPAQLKEMQESGQIAAIRDALKPKFQGQFRGADEARLAGIQQQTQAGWQFSDNSALREYAPVINHYQSLIAQGKDNEANAYIAEYVDKIPGFGKFVREGAADARAIAAHQSALTFQGVQGQALTQNAAANTRQAATQEQAMRFQTVDRLAARISDIATKATAVDKDVIGTKDGTDTLTQNLVKLSPSKERAANLGSLVATALAADPRYRRLPTDVVQNIALKQMNNVGEGPISWVWDPSKNSVVRVMKTDLDKALTDNAKRMDDNDTDRNNFRIELQRQQMLLDDAQRQAFPELQTRLDARAAALNISPGQSPAPAPGGAAAAPAAGTEQPPPAASGGTQAPGAMTPDVAAELERQRQEMKDGVRPANAFTPEVQQALEQDRVLGERAATRLEERRIEASKAAGIPVPPKPGTTKQDFSGFGTHSGMAEAASKRLEQQQYEKWARAIDRRIADQDKKAGKAK